MCPGFDAVRRWGVGGGYGRSVFEGGGSLHSSVSKLREGTLSGREPRIFCVGPECFSPIPPEAAPPPACV